MKKEEVKLKKLERKLENESDDLEREMLEIKINEKEANAASSRGYVEGAVRKLNFFTNQYDNLMKKIGKEELTEEDIVYLGYVRYSLPLYRPKTKVGKNSKN